MARILTPLGKIRVGIDGKDLLYNFEKLDLMKACPDVAGRYKIELLFIPDGKEHRIECTFPKLEHLRYEHFAESGERLECNAFYRNEAKLSIGIEADAELYDYDSEYLDNGIAYIILPETKTVKYTFGISWMDKCTNDNDCQTWYGADPTLM